MADSEPTHTFATHILRRIEPEVFATLSPAQLSAIRKAIAACYPQKRHPVDIRGALSLFFARYYFVFLIGRDQRAATQRIEAERRQKTALAGGGLFLAFALSPLLLLALLVLYFIKSALGINLFQGRHLWDLLGK